MAATPPRTLTGDLTGANRDAFKALDDLFTSYGLHALAPVIKGYLIQGFSQDTIPMLLKDTPEYQARFKGLLERQKKGFAPMNEGQYIQLQDTYKQMFNHYGLPKGMFDSDEEMHKYAAGDVSPSEMEDRLIEARKSVLSDNPSVRQTYRDWYASGLTEGDAIAAVIAPGKALPELQRKVAAAQLGGAATQQHLSLTQARAEQLQALGVDPGKAVAGFGEVADLNQSAGAIANRYGAQYDQSTAEDAVLLGDAAAVRRVRKLGERESATFGGRGVGDARSFGSGSY